MPPRKKTAAKADTGEDVNARILTFLSLDELYEEKFVPKVRIVLVFEDFGRELMTAVPWLRNRDINIRCDVATG